MSIQLWRLCRHIYDDGIAIAIPTKRHSYVDDVGSVRGCSTSPERTGKHTFVCVEAQLDAVGEFGWGWAVLGLNEEHGHL